MTKYEVEVTYIEPDECQQRPMRHHLQGLQWTATGYGSKIPTTTIARVGKRWYRVYCRIYSNIGSLYIIKGGRALYLKYDPMFSD